MKYKIWTLKENKDKNESITNQNRTKGEPKTNQRAKNEPKRTKNEPNNEPITSQNRKKEPKTKQKRKKNQNELKTNQLNTITTYNCVLYKILTNLCSFKMHTGALHSKHFHCKVVYIIIII